MNIFLPGKKSILLFTFILSVTFLAVPVCTYLCRCLLRYVYVDQKMFRVLLAVFIFSYIFAFLVVICLYLSSVYFYCSYITSYDVSLHLLKAYNLLQLYVSPSSFTSKDKLGEKISRNDA